MATTVHFRGTHAEARGLVYRLAAILAGREADTIGIARGFLLAIGVAALSDIKDAFVTKARGGTDEMGISWPRLSRAYLAYGRRFGRGEAIGLVRGAGLDPKQNRFGPGRGKGLLTAQQLERWRNIYSSLWPRFYLSTGSIQFAKARAAKIAWATLKKEGARTKLQVFGDRVVEILRNSGILLNSLSPGLLSGPPGPAASYQPPSGPGGDEQILSINAGQVIVGTSVAYAKTHNDGNFERGIPRRQFLPESGAQVPRAWWGRWLAVGAQALEVGAAMLYRQRGAA